jgi:hypothetical protein
MSPENSEARMTGSAGARPAVSRASRDTIRSFSAGAPKVRAGLAVAGEAPALPDFVIRH